MKRRYIMRPFAVALAVGMVASNVIANTNAMTTLPERTQKTYYNMPGASLYDSYFANAWDSTHVFGEAGSFHLFARNELHLDAHCNGNFAAPKVYKNSASGTNQCTDIELSYAGSVFETTANVNSSDLAIANSNTVTDAVGNPLQNGSTFDQLKINDSLTDSSCGVFTLYTVPETFINFDRAFAKVEQLSRDLTTLETLYNDVYIMPYNNSWMNNNYEDGTYNIDFPWGAYIHLKDGVNVLNIEASKLGGQAGSITLTGVQSNKEEGNAKRFTGTQALIVNVDCKGYENFDMTREVTAYWDTSEKMSFGEDNFYWGSMAIWNFYDSSSEDGLYHGSITTSNTFNGSVLAPKATITTGSNTNGTIIADSITIKAESHRADFMGKNPLTLSSKATPTPTATNTPAPTATSTPAPTATSTPAPTATNTPAPTATSTPVPTATSTPAPTATNTPAPTATSTPAPTATSTPAPTATNTPAPTATSTPAPTATNTPVPTATNTPVPTATNTPAPTATSTPAPTATSTPAPTATNTPAPTATNTPAPTATSTPVSGDASDNNPTTGTDTVTPTPTPTGSVADPTPTGSAEDPAPTGSVEDPTPTGSVENPAITPSGDTDGDDPSIGVPTPTPITGGDQPTPTPIVNSDVDVDEPTPTPSGDTDGDQPLIGDPTPTPAPGSDVDGASPEDPTPTPSTVVTGDTPDGDTPDGNTTSGNKSGGSDGGSSSSSNTGDNVTKREQSKEQVLGLDTQVKRAGLVVLFAGALGMVVTAVIYNKKREDEA